MNFPSQTLENLLSSKNILYNSLFSEFQKHLFEFNFNVNKKLNKEKIGSLFIIGAIFSDLFTSKSFSKNVFPELFQFILKTENLTYESLFKTIEIFSLCETLSTEEKILLQLFKNFVANTIDQISSDKDSRFVKAVKQNKKNL